MQYHLVCFLCRYCPSADADDRCLDDLLAVRPLDDHTGENKAGEHAGRAAHGAVWDHVEL